ncbi:MAG: family 10 glycosylhydrolase [Tannerella sp.]|jgi:uncharacterized lipoprotein YddW (UPF0748 family)|nr:family 10 glycosylhydrolase [Tannerella sp.]
MHKQRYAIPTLLLALFLLGGCASSRVERSRAAFFPKHEFRGAWIQTVFQNEYKSMSVAQLKTDFIRKLDFLKSCGINAILFQVRPEADAFYKSNLEPWSRFYTGTQGKAPEGDFDLMRFLITECHKRNMEFHAWINPYRVAAAPGESFAPSHLIHRQPGRFIKYGKQIFFDPGQPRNRQFICEVVGDIVSRYDVDAIHMDDYFYPYPIAGKPFPDDKSFKQYGIPAGYTEATRGDWRRENVNLLIREMSRTIHKLKPWVRFGVSPFGIYRNRKDYRHGSATNGLQCYDDLYADVLLWVKKGWINYNLPQLYWNIGYPRADYAVLAAWWDKHAGKKCQLYFGQDVARTMKAGQLQQKMYDEHTLRHVQGHCFWPANELLRNNGGVVDSLRRIYHRYPALPPAYTQMNRKHPKAVNDLQALQTGEGVWLSWNAAIDSSKASAADYFVVYRFDKTGKMDLNDPAHIAGITRQLSFLLPYTPQQEEFRYVVTAVNRYNNESKKGRHIRVKR